ncbi:hypothetical protein GEMRC1_004785 [Eukaryota sp. GEM-RC1]
MTSRSVAFACPQSILPSVFAHASPCLLQRLCGVSRFFDLIVSNTLLDITSFAIDGPIGQYIHRYSAVPQLLTRCTNIQRLHCDSSLSHQGFLYSLRSCSTDLPARCTISAPPLSASSCHSSSWFPRLANVLIDTNDWPYLSQVWQKLSPHHTSLSLRSTSATFDPFLRWFASQPPTLSHFALLASSPKQVFSCSQLKSLFTILSSHRLSSLEIDSKVIINHLHCCLPHVLSGLLNSTDVDVSTMKKSLKITGGIPCSKFQQLHQFISLEDLNEIDVSLDTKNFTCFVRCSKTSTSSVRLVQKKSPDSSKKHVDFAKILNQLVLLTKRVSENSFVSFSSVEVSVTDFSVVYKLLKTCSRVENLKIVNCSSPLDAIALTRLSELISIHSVCEFHDVIFDLSECPSFLIPHSFFYQCRCLCHDSDCCIFSPSETSSVSISSIASVQLQCCS